MRSVRDRHEKLVLVRWVSGRRVASQIAVQRRVVHDLLDTLHVVLDSIVALSEGVILEVEHLERLVDIAHESVDALDARRRVSLA